MGIDGHCLPTRLGWHIVQGEEIGHWVAQKIEGGYFAEQSSAIGLMKDGKILAGVIYENWNKQTVFCHIAIQGRLTKSYLKAIFDYPFNVLNVQKIIVPVVTDNQKSIKLVTNMGFAEEARIKDGSPLGDIIFMTLAKKDCRFLGVHYG
jgi:RimJ/RimL family protein N-acetyltransferase